MPIASDSPLEPPGRANFRARLWRFLLGPEPADAGPPVIPPEPMAEELEVIRAGAAVMEAEPEAAQPPARPAEPPKSELTPARVAPDSSPLPPELARAEAALNAALDSLGKAHHRPFSRA
jgi:hypothetical protein